MAAVSTSFGGSARSTRQGSPSPSGEIGAFFSFFGECSASSGSVTPSSLGSKASIVSVLYNDLPSLAAFRVNLASGGSGYALAVNRPAWRITVGFFGPG